MTSKNYLLLKAVRVANVSPSCVKKAAKMESSSWDLSFAISQASKEIKLTKAHGFIKTPHNMIWKSLVTVIANKTFSKEEKIELIKVITYDIIRQKRRSIEVEAQHSQKHNSFPTNLCLEKGWN